MAIELKFDVSRIADACRKSPEAAYTGAKRGMHDVMDDWLLKSRNVAPLDTGNLRRQLATEVKGTSLADLVGEIYGNATESSPKYGRFNYGYWLHEVHTGKLHTPGTVRKFLDEPAEQNKEKWFQHIEKEVQAELRRLGW